jgi:sulfite exporter TauE/SafE
LGDHGGTSALQWTVRIQAAVSLIAAWGLFWLGLIRVGLLHEPQWLSALGPSKIPGYGLVLHQSLHGKNFCWLYVMGLLLGLLPCGLSYAAFAKALASQQAGAGAGLSLIFGLGTLPGLLALGTSLGTLWRRFQAQADLVSGLLMVGMALSLTADALSAVF